MKICSNVRTFVPRLPEPLLLPGKLNVLRLWECSGYVSVARRARGKEKYHFSQMRKAKIAFVSLLKQWFRARSFCAQLKAMLNAANNCRGAEELSSSGLRALKRFRTYTGSGRRDASGRV